MKTFLFLLLTIPAFAQTELPPLTQMHTDAENRYLIKYPEGWILNRMTGNDGYKISILEPNQQGGLWLRAVTVTQSIDATSLIGQAIEPTFLRSNPGSSTIDKRTLTAEELALYRVHSGAIIVLKAPNDGFDFYTVYFVLCKQIEREGAIETNIWDVKWEAPDFADQTVMKQLRQIGLSLTPF
jgi:hypothetical protein